MHDILRYTQQFSNLSTLVYNHAFHIDSNTKSLGITFTDEAVQHEIYMFIITVVLTQAHCETNVTFTSHVNSSELSSSYFGTLGEV